MKKERFDELAEKLKAANNILDNIENLKNLLEKNSKIDIVDLFYEDQELVEIKKEMHSLFVKGLKELIVKHEIEFDELEEF